MRRPSDAAPARPVWPGRHGVDIFLQPVQDLTIDSESGPNEYRLSIGGVNTDEVNNWTQKLVAQLQTVEQVRNATSDAGRQGLSAYVNVDRDTASRLGISASSIDDTLYSAFGQRIVSTNFTETNQYRVILEAQQAMLASVQSLGDLAISANSTGATPLSAIAKIEEQMAPLQVTRVSQYPAATLGFDTGPPVVAWAAVDCGQASGQAAADDVDACKWQGQHIDPRIAARDRADADGVRGAGGAGGGRLHPQGARHGDTGGGHRGVAAGHVCRHVPAGLQPEQPEPDGADGGNRLCGGRRDRGAGEHQPPYRAGHGQNGRRLAGRARAGLSQLSGGLRADSRSRPPPCGQAQRGAWPSSSKPGDRDSWWLFAAGRAGSGFQMLSPQAGG
ncbi:hypothetical protein FQA39_LY19426 [Lamprigera yunnana]|nr:hypothetical protein FQA39_LY19426 [Lamprigera yunnana]